MLFAIYTLVFLAVAGLTALIYAALYAPHGVEDEYGFHRTSAQADTEPVLSTETLTGISGSSFFQY